MAIGDIKSIRSYFVRLSVVKESDDRTGKGDNKSVRSGTAA